MRMGGSWELIDLPSHGVVARQAPGFVTSMSIPIPLLRRVPNALILSVWVAACVGRRASGRRGRLGWRPLRRCALGGGSVDAALLVALAVLTAVTCVRTPVVWFKICPLLLTSSAVLLLWQASLENATCWFYVDRLPDAELAGPSALLGVGCGATIGLTGSRPYDVVRCVSRGDRHGLPDPRSVPDFPG